MNESTIRQRLRDALGESAYPPHLTSQVAAGLSRPAAKRQTGPWVLGVVAAVLAIALVVTIVFGTRAFRSRASVPVQPPVSTTPYTPGCPTASQPYGGPPIRNLTSTKMASPTTGWAEDGLRTTDGGAHWSRVLPSAIFAGMPAPALSNGLFPPGYSDFYLDGSHAWTTRTYSSSGTCYDHAAVFATSDGGRTWRQSQAIPLGAQPAWTGGFSLQFIDPLRGWLSVGLGQLRDPFTMTQEQRDLYATSDGGLHWRLVARHTPTNPGFTTSTACQFPGGKIVFVTSDVGWMSLNCQTSSPEILATTDGGVSWKMQQLPTPAGAACPCWAMLPTFFDPQDGVLEVSPISTSTGPLGATLLSTSDGGLTWQALPPGPSTGYGMITDYADSSHWYALLAQPGWDKTLPTKDWLYASADGGHSWTLVQKDLPLGFAVYTLQFLDANHGIAIQDQNASKGGPPSLGLEMLTTSDGGRTWKVSVPQVTISN
jgi:photosystem II stability/assembly factor-like uncharacterized protein